jgi:RNA polymerase primary sigma factor
LNSLGAKHKAAFYRAAIKGSVISAYVDEGRIKNILSGRTKPRVDDAKAMARLKVLLANNKKLETLIITGCQSRVEDIASKLPKVLGLEVEDLVAEGMVGLLKAIEEYDCAMETDFHHFSYRRVKNAMDAALERSRYFVSVTMTSSERETYSRLQRLFVTAEGKISGEIEDFFKEHNISPAMQERIRTRLHFLIGDHMQFHGKLQAMEKILAEDHTAGGNSDYGKNLDDLTEQVKYSLDTLTDHEKDVLMRRFGIGECMGYSQTLDEVARHYKITRERVRQIEAKALRKLRHPMRIRMFERYIDLS